MRWHWESEHYKRALGDLVLARILPAAPSVQDASDDFGELLTSGNVAAVLRKQAVALREYSESHPRDIAELVQIRDRYLAQH